MDPSLPRPARYGSSAVPAESPVLRQPPQGRGTRLVHELIATPFLGEHFVLRPGAGSGIRLPRASYDALAAAPADAACPSWLADAAGRAFGLDLAGRLLAEAVLVR